MKQLIPLLESHRNVYLQRAFPIGRFVKTSDGKSGEVVGYEPPDKVMVRFKGEHDAHPIRMGDLKKESILESSFQIKKVESYVEPIEDEDAMEGSVKHTNYDILLRNKRIGELQHEDYFNSLYAHVDGKMFQIPGRSEDVKLRFDAYIKTPRAKGFLKKVKKESINESKASEEAKRKGLEYMGFGRYGKNGKQTHTVKNDKLMPIKSKNDAGTSDSGDSASRALAQGDPQFEKPQKQKPIDVDVPDKAYNYWRDLFYKNKGIVKNTIVKQLVQTHKELNAAFAELADKNQMGGAYIKKMTNGDWIWREMRTTAFQAHGG
jgi:hypothetical protein